MDVAGLAMACRETSRPAQGVGTIVQDRCRQSDTADRRPRRAWPPIQYFQQPTLVRLSSARRGVAASCAVTATLLSNRRRTDAEVIQTAPNPARTFARKIAHKSARKPKTGPAIPTEILRGHRNYFNKGNTAG
jgi:hypothetical protein